MTTNAGVAAATSTSDATHIMVPGFAAKQVQRILNLIDTQKLGREKLQGKMEWLYDTGGSCHMTGVFEA